MRKKAVNVTNLVALDLSLAATGLAQSWGATSAITCRTISPPKGLGGAARLLWIVNALDEAVVSKTHDTVVIIEEMAFAAHDRNHERAGLAWIVRCMLHEYKVPYILVAPTTLKKSVTGSGKGDKSKMQLTVWRNWAVECANDNEADAVGLLQMLRDLAGGTDPATLPKYRRECLAVVSKANAPALVSAGFATAKV